MRFKNSSVFKAHAAEPQKNRSVPIKKDDGTAKIILF